MPEPMTDLNDMRKFSNAIRLKSEQRIADLTKQLADGELDVSAWQLAMKDVLREAYKNQFVIGRGGVSEGIKTGEYGFLGPELKRQYQYLSKFAKVVEAAVANESPLTFAITRAKLYGKSTQAVFWKTAIPVDLPQVPRDGKTDCRTNCKCRLDFGYGYGAEGNRTAVLVYWRMAPAEHCGSCLKLAREWNPKRFDLTASTKESSIEQAIALFLMESPELHPVSKEIYSMWGIEILEEDLCHNN